MILKLTALIVALVPLAALAAGAGAGHGSGGIPSSVYFQAINFALFVGLMVYLLRGPIKSYFGNREKNYRQALAKAEAARKEAEARQRDMQQRLTKLESSAAETVANARAEAAALKAKIIADAQDLSRHLQEEATRTANIEIERAKTQLREEMLTQAITLSRKLLEEKIAEPDQKRLQTEFVDKIQVVR